MIGILRSSIGRENPVFRAERVPILRPKNVHPAGSSKNHVWILDPADKLRRVDFTRVQGPDVWTRF